MDAYRNGPRALFIFTVDGIAAFWMYDGSLYHRFSTRGERPRYVRTQPRLPAFALGFCVTPPEEELEALQGEIDAFQLPLRIFASVTDCQKQAILQRHAQYVFDNYPPVGLFTLETGKKGL